MSPMLPLFVYGTLMWADVLKAVIGRIPLMEDAVIEGYRRVKIRDAIYPALIRAPSFSVRGKL
ncbi:MAG: gamma-glutamylcyclotransferase, partial [Nitrospirae bacterium]